eukprot:sb/3478803/
MDGSILCGKSQNAQGPNLYYYLQQTCPVLIRSTLTLTHVFDSRDEVSTALLFELPLAPVHSPVKMDEASVSCLHYSVNVKVEKVAQIVGHPFQPTNFN